MTTPLNPKEMGQRGGRRNTEAQALARRRNILKALAKQHPRSTHIQQALEKAQMEEAALKRKEA
jgi:hypothetical protein